MSRFRTIPRIRICCVVVLIVSGLTGSSPVRGETPEYVREIVVDAKVRATSVDGQVAALMGLAWPEEPDPDPLVQAAARQAMVRYGKHALPVLRRAIPGIDPLYQADATAALVEARYKNAAGMPPDFLPGLEEAIWDGSVEAQRIALNEVRRYSFPKAVLSSIDAAYLHPELTRYVLHSLGHMGDRRAQPFMTDVLFNGATIYKKAAASALAAHGNLGVDVLRRAAASDDAAVRQAAMPVLLPRAGTDDLTLLHEYFAVRTDDAPELRQAVRERAVVLEQRLENQQAADAASAEEE